MFVLKREHTYTWPVEVRVPQDGGTYATQKLEATFRLLDQSRTDDVLERRQALDADFAREVWIGWDGVEDEAGKPIPFSAEAREQLLGIPYVRAALVRAYFESVLGAPAKN